MKAWKKGAVFGAVAGIVLSIILIFITFGLYTPPFGVGSNPINYFIFHLVLGGIFGALFAISIDLYGKYEKNVSYKYPLAGAILFFLIKFFLIFSFSKGKWGIFHPLGLFRLLVKTIFQWDIVLFIVMGLILGYLVGKAKTKGRERTGDVGR